MAIRSKGKDLRGQDCLVLMVTTHTTQDDCGHFGNDAEALRYRWHHWV